MAPSSKSEEKKRRALTIEDLANILQRLNNGEAVVDLATEYKVCKSTISNLKNKENQIINAKQILEACDGDIKKNRFKGTENKPLENKLFEWFQQQRLLGNPVNGPILQSMALKFNEGLKGDPKFKASEGWLSGFKKRHGIRYLSIQGEKLSSDNQASEEFKQKLANIVNVTCIGLDFIYNCDETGLFWKMLPNKTLVGKREKQAAGRKKPKNRVTLMCCTNASGTHMIPLSMIGISRNPICFRGVNQVPIHYLSQESAWMEGDLMIKWYKEVFIPSVKNKHQLDKEVNKNIKFILLMGNAPCHPASETFHQHFDSCTIIFFPPNVTSLIQPMDQGIIAKFEKTYRTILLKTILAKGDKNEDFYKRFNLLNCANFCILAWNAINADNIRNCWKPLIPLQSDSSFAIETVDISAIHNLVMQIPELQCLTVQDTTNWLEVDEQEAGWRVRTDAEILSGEVDNGVEELDDEVSPADLNSTAGNDDDNIDVLTIGLDEGTKKLEEFIYWYQKYRNSSTLILESLHECHLSLIKDKVDEMGKNFFLQKSQVLLELFIINFMGARKVILFIFH